VVQDLAEAGYGGESERIANGDMPGTEAVESLARLFRGTIEVVSSETDNASHFYGDGPLLVALRHAPIVGPDGSSAMHYELLQSWLSES
jgi:hypothetical protein